MRVYQENMVSAIVAKSDWMGNNTEVTTENNVTKVRYYRSTIGTINHTTKNAECSNCGYATVSTTSRINAIKMAANELGYKVIEK